MINEADLLKVLASVDEAQALLRELLGGRKNNSVPVDMEFLDTKLEGIDFGRGFTVRANYVFKYHYTYDENFKQVYTPLITVRELVTLTEAEILRQPNVGRKTVKRIKEILSAHGLRLGMTL